MHGRPNQPVHQFKTIFVWNEDKLSLILIGRVCFRSYNFLNHSISLYHDQAKIQTSGQKYFKLVQALAGNGHQLAVSFQSEEAPNYYLRHRGWFKYADPQSTTNSFKEDASFLVHKRQWFPGYYKDQQI